MFVVNVDGPNIWATRERDGCIFTTTSNSYLQVFIATGVGLDFDRSEYSLLAFGADPRDSFALTNVSRTREKQIADP